MTETIEDGCVDVPPLEDQEVEEEEGGEEPPLPSFFAEKAEAADIIAYVGSAVGLDPAGRVQWMGDDGGTGVASRLFQLEVILVRYQEVPTLLLPHLEDLMAPLLRLIAERIPKGCNTTSLATEVFAPFDDVCGNYDPDAPKSVLHHLCRALYFVVKVAGPKACTAHFPCDVKVLEDVFYCLRRWQVDPSLRVEWEVRYCMLLWMSSLVLVPFTLKIVDSALAESGGKPLAEQLTDCAWDFMNEPSKCREAAAMLVARLNTRPDAHDHRESFFKRAAEAIESGSNMMRNGVLQAVAATYKTGKREELAPYSEALVSLVGDVSQATKDVKTAKLAIKVVQRLGLSLLVHKDTSWQYRQHKGNLEENLGALSGGGAHVAEVKVDTTPTEDEDESVPSVIEDVIGYLLAGLSHRDTIVRWSAAKGIGRLCARLPKEMATDVVLAVTEVFDLFENDCGWHGGCLALAELCRRSILLPEQMVQCIPFVVKGLLYDLSRGTFSVGAHVRDAACYVCWSLARAYNPADLETYVNALSTTLVLASLFDREVNVRRAASAALQECVGRLGNFPNGIELVTTVDFAALATARSSYLSVAPLIAVKDAYRGAIVDHLLNSKLYHWDRRIRRLAAAALATTFAIDVSYADRHLKGLVTHSVAATEISERHGALMAVAEAIGTLPTSSVPQSIVDEAVGIVPALESRRLFRGRGGEFVREAACRLILSISKRGHTLPAQVEVLKVGGQTAKTGSRGQLQKFLEDTWKQPLEWLQTESINAFAAFSSQYYVEYVPAFHGKVFTTMIDGVQENKPPNERRGNILALGAIPPCIVSAPDPTPESTRLCWEVTLDTLCNMTITETDKDKQDAESRRNAVRALSTLVTTLGKLSLLTPATLATAVNTILANSMEDYAVDKRGDVGSFARIAGLQHLPTILEAGIGAGLIGPGKVGSQLVRRYIEAALQQCVGKIDKLRSIAGGTLCAFLCGGAEMYHPVQGRSMLDTLIAQVAESELGAASVERLQALVAAPIVDWSASQETFPLVLLTFLVDPALAPSVMRGVVVSVGGLSAHVTKHAQAAFCECFTENREAMSTLLVSTAAKAAHDARLIIPICVSFEKLVSRDLLHPSHYGDVVDMLYNETKHFGADISKMLAFLPLLGALCQAKDAAVRAQAWYLAVVLAASRYPKVRNRAAAELYSALLIDAGGIDAGPAMEVLSTTQWDGTDTAGVRGARDRLYPLLGLATPSSEEGGALSMSDRTNHLGRNLVMGTYKSLVREAGY